MNHILIKILAIEQIDELNLDFTNNLSIQEGKVVYNKDGTFNRIRIDDNIFVNISSKSLKNDLKKLIGKKF